MTTTRRSKREKVADLVKNWDSYKGLTLNQIGEKFDVSDRTIYSWRKKLAERGVVLNMDNAKEEDGDIFDSFARK